VKSNRHLIGMIAGGFASWLSVIPGTAQDTTERTRSIVVPGGRLSNALDQLGRSADVDLLFSPAEIGDAVSGPLRGRMTVEHALALLLRNTPFFVKRTTDGSFLITARPLADVLPVPEIIVTARRSQDLDIRRTVNDVQPYRVFTRQDVQASRASSLSEFVRTRLPSDSQLINPAQQASSPNASPRSLINLHGLSSDQTLVLVDGGRMPSIPSSRGYFLQPDLNGLPVEGIERIEVLTQTSGGIYGTGAVGGVVNVVLRHDVPGVELTGQYGPTTQGGGTTRRINARFGFTPDEGATNVELLLAASGRGDLLAGDRSYASRSRAIDLSKRGAAAIGRYYSTNGVLVRGDTDLNFASPSGRVSLGSDLALLPAGSSGSTSDAYKTSLQDLRQFGTDQSGTKQSLLMASDTRSLLANVRHRFGDGLQAFVDLIDMRNDGRSRLSASPVAATILASNPFNPFDQDVFVTFSAPLVGRRLRTSLRSTRLSTGLIASLGRDWSAVGHIAIGRTKTQQILRGTDFDYRVNDALDGVSQPDRPAVNLFGDWSTLMTGLRSYVTADTTGFKQRGGLVDLSGRVAGPLFALPGGAAAFTGLVEERRERVRGGRGLTDGQWSDDASASPYDQRVRSIYGELRLPVLSGHSGPKLEMQLATRFDAIRSHKNAEGETEGYAMTDTVLRQNALVYTVGIKARPAKWLMLRTSMASGAVPTAMIAVGTQTYDAIGVYPDPARRGRVVGSEGRSQFVLGATSNAETEMSQSLSAGLVLNPDSRGLPRLSVDLTHIDYRRQWVPSDRAIPYVLANEARYPGRVLRAGLTDADRAAGLTSGVVTRIDASDITQYRSKVDTVDIDLSSQIESRRGSIRIYGSATWTPSYVIRESPLEPWKRRGGTADGPVKWRGNAGFELRRADMQVGLNGQFVGPYKPSLTSFEAPTIKLLLPGSVRSQVYFDLTGGVTLPLDSIGNERPQLRVALLNVFDRKASYDPTVLGYSGYGDPRGRRIDVVLAVRL
jgi:iron complex outermembrane receptor protein